MGKYLEAAVKQYSGDFKGYESEKERFEQLEQEYIERAKAFLEEQDRAGTIINELWETRIRDKRLDMKNGHLNGQILCIVCNQFVQRPRIWGDSGLVPYHLCDAGMVSVTHEYINIVEPLNSDLKLAQEQTNKNKALIPRVMKRDQIRRMMARHGVTEPKQLIALGVTTREFLESAGVTI